MQQDWSKYNEGFVQKSIQFSISIIIVIIIVKFSTCPQPQTLSFTQSQKVDYFETWPGITGQDSINSDQSVSIVHCYNSPTVLELNVINNMNDCPPIYPILL